MTDIELRSLAPEYNEDHHKTYVSRLDAAVSDPRNKNIALTGRYGVGKSSILDNFIKGQETPSPGALDDKNIQEKATKRRKKVSPKKILRISINTLGPDKGEDLTNRIQKELVKQLVYRAKPGEVRSSEFARTPGLTWWRAGLDALGVAVVLVSLFWLFGLRPVKDSLGTDDFWLPMATLFGLVLGILWAIRWYIGNRVVAQVSAGGASIALEGKSDSFFDKYLDELITFFEATEPDIVVFEDLDRFDDPRIFDSLRELNTLVNSSAHWRDRPDQPLRFVYAIKDSLFEKLGDQQQEKDEAENKTEGVDASSSGASAPATTSEPASAAAFNVTKSEKKDAAAEAVERANRTKFFEIVIPVVPFLSHSNARDHFLTELGELGLPDDIQIDRGLIDIVARHTTDMRLMLNIGNEFVVYAERLLWVDGTKRKCAPGLTADLLFALVVYKNFHLADFEVLPHRGSALDILDQKRQALVNDSIKALETERAGLVRGIYRQQKQQSLAATLGARLAALQESTGMTLVAAKVRAAALSIDATTERSFWQPIAQAGMVELSFRHRSGHPENTTLRGSNLNALFPEVADAGNWEAVPSPTDTDRIAEIDGEITALPRASFKLLASDTRYKSNGMTFEVLAENALPSQLALDLVKQGHIDRFYAEYSTAFYGKFLGVDVANFFRNNVWPNEMSIRFPFTTKGAAANVLEQAPADFLRTRSALNIDIVDHLMALDASSSSDLIGFLALPNNTDGQHFLTTYFNAAGSRCKELVSRLAVERWRTLFNFIASAGTIDIDEKAVVLLNAALLSARRIEDFELDDAARALIARLHTEIPAFRLTQRGASMKTLFAFLTAALPSIPSLRALSPELQKLAVNAKQYTLDAGNIRAAASLRDEAPISAEDLIAKPAVWAYCTENIDDYLDLVESDEHTPGSCASPGILAQVLNAQHEDWSAEEMEAFLDASTKSAALPDVTEVEQTVWTTVVDRQRVTPNVTNLEAYTTEIGVDDALAALLKEDDGTVVGIINLEDTAEEQLELLIPRLLNAQAVFEPRQRVLLAKQLWDSPVQPGIDLSDITASPDELLAELLREGMVDDSEEVFAHFSGTGWPSIGPALSVSTNAATFVTPAMVQGHAADVVRETGFPTATRRAILSRLVEFAPTEDRSFLIAAASAARELHVSLSAESLALVAPAVRNHEDVVWQLKEQLGSIAAGTAMQILSSMSGDFVGFAGTAGQKFAVGDTPSLESVLTLLKGAGMIAHQSGRQPRGRWKLRIA
ncbi:hypothetical protein V6245_05545 [Salinibacterium amurskyense]|uniref:YobI family P-loop NTPase n=1 Tax=Salinibacterium amurskyense TaxID=205941 RepID=UPI00311E9CF8